MSSVPDVSREIRPSRSLFALGLLVSALAASCGRVGYELTYLDGPGSQDGIGFDGGSTSPDCTGPLCPDLCPDDPAKTQPGLCGCGVPESNVDADNDGILDCISPCVPVSADDTTCDGIDDDCDGIIDEDHLSTPTVCGHGVCGSVGELLCSAGQLTDTCMAIAPTATLDDPIFPGNGIDDDCDGIIDEDAASGCDTTPKEFAAGAHNLSVPAGCTTITVQLWGGGGGSGGRSSGDIGTPGRGGAGGYASSTLTLSGALQLYVANGGRGCGAGGTTSGVTTYNGGAGGEPGVGSTSAGKAGNDGSTAGGNGGSGGGGVSPGTGGRGFFGGGGGGAGGNAPWPPYGGNGGGGGAATVLMMNGARAVVAGGGGGGGGMTGAGSASFGNAGIGGEGCGGTGGNQSSGGGGGGGGICTGTATQGGTDGAPANAGSIPAGRAAGGMPTDSRDCFAGGAGHAIVTFGI